MGGGMEGRDREMTGWRDGGMEGRDRGMTGWRDGGEG